SITSKAVVSGWRGIGGILVCGLEGHRGDPRVWAGGTSGGSSCAGWRGFGGPPPRPSRAGGGRSNSRTWIRHSIPLRPPHRCDRGNAATALQADAPVGRNHQRGHVFAPSPQAGRESSVHLLSASAPGPPPQAGEGRGGGPGTAHRPEIGRAHV